MANNAHGNRRDDRPAVPWAPGSCEQTLSVPETGDENQLAKQDEKLIIEGKVVEALPNTTFRVRLDNDHEVLAYLSGRMRKYYIRVLLGDRVRVELSPYDLTKGRIVYRHKSPGGPAWFAEYCAVVHGTPSIRQPWGRGVRRPNLFILILCRPQKGVDRLCYNKCSAEP